MKKIAFLLLSMVLLVACEEETPVLPQDPDQETPDVVTLKLTESEVTVKIGETHQLMVDAALPEGTVLVWTSENSDVATISDKGLITAVADGTTNVSVALADGSQKVSCVVNVVLVALENQYEFNSEVDTIGSVVELATANGYRFNFYDQQGVTTLDETPVLELFILADSMGKDIDLLQAVDAEIVFKAQKCTAHSGSLKVSKDKFGKKVIVSLDVKCDLGRLRAEYEGAFSVTYMANNDFVVTTNDSVDKNYTISSVLRQNPTTTGGRTGFAFTNVKVNSVDDCSASDYAVWVEVSQSALYKGTIDMKTDKDKYTLTFIDYKNEIICDKANSKVKSGTLTTYQATDGRVYIALDVTVERDVAREGEVNSYTITAEYFGATIDVNDLNPMISVFNKYIYYNNDGEESANKKITQLQLLDVVAADRDTFYFVSADELAGGYSNSCPMLIVSNELINAGEIDCSDSEKASLFKLKYNTISLGLQGGTTTYVPTNGTLFVSKDDSNIYTISLDITNRYVSNSAYGGYESGDSFRLKVNYRGTATKK